MTLFQKIIDREIPARIVYEDDDVLAFLDISQQTPGHTLVIPKKATASVLTAPEETIAVVNIQAAKIAKRLIDALGASGANLLSNAGEVAGQTVFHYHVHIIPRYEEDELKLDIKEHSSTIDEVYETIKEVF